MPYRAPIVRGRLPATPILLLIIFTDLVGFGMIIPILPFMSLAFGATPFEGTLLVSIYAVFAFICGPIWGRLSDRIGRRPTLMLTLIGAVGAYTLLGLAESLVMLYVARAASGAMAGNIGVVMATMADLTPAQDRARGMGYIGAVFGLGFAVGPGLGGMLAGSGPEPEFSRAAFAAAAMSGTALILALVFLPETRRQGSAAGGLDAQTRPKSILSFFRTPRQALLMAQFFVANMAQSMSFGVIGFWADIVLGWDQRQVALMIMAQGFMIALLQSRAVGPLTRRFGEVRVFRGAQIFQMTGCAMLIAVPAPPYVVISYAMIIGGQTLSYPTLNSLLSRRTDAHTQGTALGLSNGISALGRVFGPPVGGLLLMYASPMAPFLTVASLGLLAVFWAFSEIRRDRVVDQPGPREPDRLAGG